MDYDEQETSSELHDRLLKPLPARITKGNLIQQYCELQEAFWDMRSQRNLAEGNCIIMFDEIRQMRERAKAWEQRTLEEAIQEEKSAKEYAKAAAGKSEKKKNVRLQSHVRDNGTRFEGSLATKRKSELQIIAAALGLPNEGTKATLCKAIKAYCHVHPELKVSARFGGLFARSKMPSSD